MHKDYFFVINPHSARGRTAKLWPEIRAAFESKIGNFDFAFTKGSIHATYLTGKAIYDGYKKIVAVGGDGTLNEVLNGFYDADKKINGHSVLCYLPSGTGEDIARTLGSDKKDIPHLAHRILSGRPEKVDIGLASFTKKDGSKENRRFINEASVGFSGNVANYVNKAGGLLRGKSAFYAGVVMCLAFLRNHRIKMKIDGRDFGEKRYLTICCCNGAYFGGGMMIAPGASLKDGHLDVVTIDKMGRIEVIDNIGSIYKGTHINNKKASIIKAKEISLSSREKVYLEMDGELVGFLKAKIKILEKEIDFIG